MIIPSHRNRARPPHPPDNAYPLSAPPADTAPDYGVGRCPVAERMIEETLVIALINEGFTDEDTEALGDVLVDAYKQALQGSG